MSLYNEQIFQISLNENNLDPSDNNKSTYIYNFPSTKYFRDTKIALGKINIFYSWFNITEALGNNKFDYIFTDGSGSTTYSVTIPDGFYTVSDLNTYLQFDMIENGLYLVNADGDNVYYLEITENSTYYAIQLNNYAFPDSLPSGWSNPNSLSFPASPSTTQFVILNNNFTRYIGFNAQTIPASIENTNQSNLSDFTPQVNSVSSLILDCNLLNNNANNPPSLFYPFSAAGTSFGGLIESQPIEYLWLDVNEGYYNNIIIRILDQNYNRVKIQDSNVVIQLVFRQLKEGQQ